MGAKMTDGEAGARCDFTTPWGGTVLLSTTACPTKPEVYGVDRSSRPRRRGALHNQDVGEVGSTRTIVSERSVGPLAGEWRRF